MAAIIDLDLARKTHRARALFDAVTKGQQAQARAARLAGRDVVVFGFNTGRGGYDPLFVVVDPDLALELDDIRSMSLEDEFAAHIPGRHSPPDDTDGRPGPDPDPAPVPGRRERTWFRDQMDRMVQALNHLDDGWPSTSRYATLKIGGTGEYPPVPTEVVVFGPRAGDGVKPAFVFIDRSLRKQLTDIRVLHLSPTDEDMNRRRPH